MLKNQGIAIKISVIIGIMVLALIASVGVTLKTEYDAMLDERVYLTKSLAGTAAKIGEMFNAKITSGEMDKETALGLWKDVVGAMRYGDGDYLFVNNYDGTSAVHPRADMIGKNLLGMKDANGVSVTQKLIAAARSGPEGGMVAYQWPKEKDGDPVGKVSWMTSVEGFQAAVGTGVYVDDVVDKFFGSLGIALGVGGGFTLAALIVVMAISKDMTSVLRDLVSRMGRIAGGDFTVAIPGADRGDEAGAMAKALEIFREKVAETDRLRRERAEMEASNARERKAQLVKLAKTFEDSVNSVVRTVASGARSLRSDAQSMYDLASGTKSSASVSLEMTESNQQSFHTVASASEELSASIREIGSQTERARLTSQTAVEAAESSSVRVNGLVADAEKIGAVITLIEDIASQTNLLALNATIEAARAGDSGKGFAVVANEVKSLANQTQRATVDIRDQIERVRSSVTAAATDIGDIRKVIHEIAEAASAIAAAIEEQGAATNEISRNVQEVMEGSGVVGRNIRTVAEAAVTTEQTADKLRTASREMEGASESLGSEVSRFLEHLRQG
ncbi:MAG: methyl-accepting chemotaxis protein [Rhodospirillum sp.]|nr:methyl-accepting chemotaxis protein [Rhodospirillum sp.]MCF8488461.1 methyl-accepting chemotaxis protein [Rhodospirillum sp.]MCF8499123.1 methyl-accepting chemotaxis protein [Rhodospirillum sp.]